MLNLTKAERFKKHGATKVILFGSVLDHTFKLDSDIDIAVEMPSAAWWEWYFKLGEVLQFPIDLVRLGKINESFREIIFNLARRFMTGKNGVAALQARIEKELREIKKIVELVEKNLAGISQKTPEDIVVVGFAGDVHNFYDSFSLF